MKFGAGAMEGFLIGKRRWTALAASVVTLRRLTPVLQLVPNFPLSTWGLDEQHAGEMWSSNSLTWWLVVAGVRCPTTHSWRANQLV